MNFGPITQSPPVSPLCSHVCGWIVQDLDRQIVKSDRASVRIPELDFEIPPGTQNGVFTTIEGLLDKAIDGLAAGQEIRRRLEPEAATAIDAFLEKLRGLRAGTTLPFTFVLDDPSGNSFVENPHVPRHDPNMKVCPESVSLFDCTVASVSTRAV